MHAPLLKPVATREPEPAQVIATLHSPAPVSGLTLECTNDQRGRGNRKVVIRDATRGTREAYVSERVLVHLLWFYARRKANPQGGWLRVKAANESAKDR